MKTYDIWKMADEDYNSVADKKVKLVKMPHYNDKISLGDIAQIGKNARDVPCLFDSRDRRIEDLTGFEEWEEVKEPVTFMELIEEVRTRPGTTFKYSNSERHYYFTGTLGEFLFDIADVFLNESIAEIISEGEFYIED